MARMCACEAPIGPAVWSTAKLAHGLTLGLVGAVVLRLAEIGVVHEVREGLALPGNLDTACESNRGSIEVGGAAPADLAQSMRCAVLPSWLILLLLQMRGSRYAMLIDLATLWSPAGELSTSVEPRSHLVRLR